MCNKLKKEVLERELTKLLIPIILMNNGILTHWGFLILQSEKTSWVRDRYAVMGSLKSEE